MIIKAGAGYLLTKFADNTSIVKGIQFGRLDKGCRDGLIISLSVSFNAFSILGNTWR